MPRKIRYGKGCVRMVGVYRQCGYRKKIGRDERLDGDFGGISTRGRGKREAEWSGREKRKKRGGARKIKR